MLMSEIVFFHDATSVTPSNTTLNDVVSVVPVREVAIMTLSSPKGAGDVVVSVGRAVRADFSVFGKHRDSDDWIYKIDSNGSIRRIL